MELPIWCSDKFRHDWKHFIEFVQHQANRLAFGYPRYEARNGGRPSKKQNYLTRLEKELKKYKKNGNREHLLNISNYAWLESQAPQNPKYHWDVSEISASRPHSRSDTSTYFGHSAIPEPFRYRREGD